MTLAGVANPIVQNYKYDSLYRLTEAEETAGATQNWVQQFQYDRFGNRIAFCQTLNKTSGAVQTTTTPLIDQATNRFVTANQNFRYDKNGNLTTDGDNREVVFNGENKQHEVKNASGQTIGRYLYDGEGKRVKKITWNSQGASETTIFVYSAGKLVAEYSDTQVPVVNKTTRYLSEDHLGTPRVITDSEGNVISRRDFLPFGEEITPDIGARSSVAAYQPTNDNVKQKFTGYQKDDETGLDFAEARMYENRHGRFNAVDPLLASGKSANPQTFNRFAYCLNSPLACTDPSGMDGTWYKTSDPKILKEKCDGCTTFYESFESNPGNGWDTVDFGGQFFQTVGTRDGTTYIYSDGRADNGQIARDYRRMGDSLSQVLGGGGCEPSYQCALARSPAERNEQLGSAWNFSEGLRIGASSEFKGFADPATWHLITATPGTSLNELFGVPTIFGYEQPTAKQQLGAFVGRVGVNTLVWGGVTWAGIRLANPATLSTNEIHWMQSSIKNTHSDGFTVTGNAESLRLGDLKPTTLRISVWRDEAGKIWTLDNRRLAAFKLSGLERVPVRWASRAEISNQMWKMTTRTNGVTIRLKFGNGKSKVIQ